ncbi:hypothetical protein DV738_g3363, partial [Chaetothyriales sp. CBS 135597]
MDLDLNVLEGKLNAILDRPTEDPAGDPASRHASPSLASTSSEALQFNPAVYRKPAAEEDQAKTEQESEYLRTLFWGDEPTRRARDERFAEEDEALQNLAIHGWGICEGYERETLRLAVLRKAEDGSRDISAEGYTSPWTETDQRALEFQRQKEDYLQVADKLSIFLAGDEESESEKVLRYRLRNLKTLLQLYDSQWHESFGRLREDAHRRKQRTQDPAEIKADGHGSKVQTSLNNQPVGNESPALVDSPKGSKPAGSTRKGPRRRPNISADAAEPQPLPVGGTTRRSRRTQPPPVASISEAPVLAASEESPLKRVLRQRPGRNVAINDAAAASSAKPQGVSKRPPAKTTRRKAKKR